MEISRLIVKRSKWARQTLGVYNGTSALLNSQGCMCCLGFLGEAAGISRRFLVDIGSPSEQLSENADDYAEDTEYVDGLKAAAAMWPAEFLPRESDDECREGERLETIHSIHDTNVANEAIAINDDERTTDAEKETLLTELFERVGITLTFED